jgi:retron-type reverse transcriptase
MKASILRRALATSLLAGELDIEQATTRLAHTLGHEWRWLRPLANRYVKAFAGRPRPHRREVEQFIRQDRGFRKARAKHYKELFIAHWLAEPQVMQPAPSAARWNIPPITSVADLADWLGLDVGDLLWLADLRGITSKTDRPRLQHYHYRVLAKASGGIRLIEIPKPRLKDVQRQILFHILNRIDPHPSAHGFLRDRSVKTFVAPHIGRRIILRLDLQDFFPSFSGARIAAFFRVAGYPDSVADLLAGLCTTVAPRKLWSKSASSFSYEQRREASDLYSTPHLPQGAPTSPALANVCAYRVDCRLAGLAKSAGAEYTRYADDLAFSGNEEFERHAERFSLHVAAILLEEGFRVNHRKTRIMRQGVRQHLAGVVANQRINVMRPEFERLKATLTNCIRHGPETQNREAHPQFRSHLQGRVAFVESLNPERGQRLRSLFEQIQWS